VYLLILDGYANQVVLQKFFDYDNQEFIDSLIELGFFVPNQYTNSNYIGTHNSVPSILNMDYVDHLVPSGVSDKYKEEVLSKSNSNNIVMQNFKAMGYKNISLDSGWLGTRVVDIADENLCENSNDSRILNLLKGNTILQSLILIMLNESEQDPSLNVLNNLDQVPIDHEKRQKVFCNLSELPQIHQKFEEPVFVFWHILSPHTPWVFDSNGDPPLQKVSSLMKNVEKRQTAYLNEMEFINKKTIDKILLESNSPPIIILQGDHGPGSLRGDDIIRGDKKSDEFIRERMSIFNAYYFPDQNSKLIYDSITPVNSFRLILNEYFNENYELLDDKNYFSSYKQWYNFTDVTERILWNTLEK